MKKNYLLLLLCIGMLVVLPQQLKAQNSCLPPQVMAVIGQTQNTAVLQWSITNTNSLYTIRFKQIGASNWTPVTATSSPFTVSGLTCNSQYVWQMQQTCSTSGTTNTISPWSAEASFATTACPVTCPAPTGLSITNITQSSAQLAWTGNSTTTSGYTIRYQSAASPNWTTITNITAPGYTLSNLNCGSIYVIQVQQTCYNGSSTGSVSDWSASFTLSTLACNTPCVPPTTLETNSISATSANLQWGSSTNSTGTFNIRYKANNSTTWMSLNNLTAPYYQLSNLLCNTIYIWQVQRICTSSPTGVVTLSPWSSEVTFTTASCPVNCPTPTNLQTVGITANSAILIWNYVGSATSSYRLRYRNTNTSTWTVVPNVTTQHTLSNLVCNANYIWQLQLLCYNTASTFTESPWSAEASFATTACPVTCPAPTQLATNTITTTSAVLTNNSPLTVVINYNVRYKATNATTWTTLSNITLPNALSGLNCGVTYIWQAQQICTNGNLCPWSADLVFTTLNCAATCIAPVAIETTAVNATSATLVWSIVNSNNQVYIVRYSLTNSTTWTTVNFTNSPFTLTGLTCGASYIWQVQQVCSTASPMVVSPWSNDKVFTTSACTPPPCVTPTNLQTTSISATSAVLNWGSATTVIGLYNIRYKTANGIWVVVNNVNTPNYQLGNLICNKTYVWQIQKICAITGSTNGSVSTWSNEVSFSTLACPINCGTPTGLVATNFSPLSANLTWNTVPGANAYIVRYKKMNSNATFTIVTSNTNTVSISGLMPLSMYQWQVKAICGIGTTLGSDSAWSAPSNLYTPTQLLVYPNPVSDYLQLVFMMDKNALVVVEIRDTSGKKVHFQSENRSMGYNEIQIKVSELSNGLYFLTLQYGDYSETSKVMIRN
jgi:hypothetical protein